MNLEKSLYIVENEFNKIAESISSDERKQIIKDNKKDYKKFRSDASLTLGKRIRRGFTAQGIKDGIVDQLYGMGAGTGANLLHYGITKKHNPVIGNAVSVAPYLHRTNKRRTNRANNALEDRFGDNTSYANHMYDIKRAYAQSLKNHKNEIDNK